MNPIGIDEQIACVERELTMRRRVYERRIGEGKMTAKAADREMLRMMAVLETLRRVALERAAAAAQGALI